MAKTTQQYLCENGLSLDYKTALIFTLNDYDFITFNSFDKIVINDGKESRREVLTIDDIIERIKELFILWKDSPNYEIGYFDEKRIEKIISHKSNEK